MNTSIHVFVPISEYEDDISAVHVRLFCGAAVFEGFFTKESSPLRIELPEGQPVQYEYQYEAYYRGGGSITSDRRQTSDGLLVVCPSRRELGLARLAIVCPVMQQYRSVTVTVDVDGEHWAHVFSNSSKEDPAWHTVGLGHPFSGAYRYQSRYVLEDFRVVETDWMDGQSDLLHVPGLFQDRRLVTFTAALSEEPSPEYRFALALVHRDAYGFEEEYPFSLGPRNPYWEWGGCVIDPARARFGYHGFFLGPDGTVLPIPETEVTGSVVVLQASTPD
jgi:hypothetical protein